MFSICKSVILNLRYMLLLTTVLLIVSLFSVAKANDTETVKRMVYQWSEANNKRDLQTLSYFYADQLIYYGKELDKNSCLLDKRKLFGKYKQYYQSINSDILVTRYGSNTYKCEFGKMVSVNAKKLKTYPSYLVIKKVHSNYYITAESDLISDANAGYILYLNSEDNNPLALGILPYSLGILCILAIVIILIRYLNRKIYAYKSQTSPESLSKDRLTDTDYSTLTPEQQKGYLFEKYVVSLVSTNKGFSIESWRGDKTADRYIKANSYPDLEIELKLDKVYSFAIECKWRAQLWNGKIEWAKEHQYKNYTSYESDKQKPVFIVLGIGGTPSIPENIYIIPLKHLKSVELSFFELNKYRRNRSGKFYFDTTKQELC